MQRGFTQINHKKKKQNQEKNIRDRPLITLIYTDCYSYRLSALYSSLLHKSDKRLKGIINDLLID